MKTPITLKEARTEIRSIFREKAYELFDGIAIKNLTPDQRFEAISATVKSGALDEVNTGKDTFFLYSEILEAAFKEDFKVISSTMKEAEWKEKFDSLLELNKTDAPKEETKEISIRESVINNEDDEPVDIAYLSDMVIEFIGENALDENEILSLLKSNGLQMNEESFNTLKEVVTGKLHLAKETPSNVPVTKKEIAPIKKETESPEATEAEVWAGEINRSETEDALRETLSLMNERKMFVFSKANTVGVVTATGTNKSKDNRPFLVITLEDGTVSRPFADIFDRYFQLINSPDNFTKLNKGKESEEITSLENEHASFSYNETEKQVNGADLKDRNNEPRCYSKSKRGLKKAWGLLVESWTKETTMSGGINILSEAGIKMHSWCAMD